MFNHSSLPAFVHPSTYNEGINQYNITKRIINNNYNKVLIEFFFYPANNILSIEFKNLPIRSFNELINIFRPKISFLRFLYKHYDGIGAESIKFYIQNSYNIKDEYYCSNNEDREFIQSIILGKL